MSDGVGASVSDYDDIRDGGSESACLFPPPSAPECSPFSSAASPSFCHPPTIPQKDVNSLPFTNLFPLPLHDVEESVAALALPVAKNRKCMKTLTDASAVLHDGPGGRRYSHIRPRVRRTSSLPSLPLSHSHKSTTELLNDAGRQRSAFWSLRQRTPNGLLAAAEPPHLDTTGRHRTLISLCCCRRGSSKDFLSLTPPLLAILSALSIFALTNLIASLFPPAIILIAIISFSSFIAKRPTISALAVGSVASAVALFILSVTCVNQQADYRLGCIADGFQEEKQLMGRGPETAVISGSTAIKDPHLLSISLSQFRAYSSLVPRHTLQDLHAEPKTMQALGGLAVAEAVAVALLCVSLVGTLIRRSTVALSSLGQRSLTFRQQPAYRKRGRADHRNNAVVRELNFSLDGAVIVVGASCFLAKDVASVIPLALLSGFSAVERFIERPRAAPCKFRSTRFPQPSLSALRLVLRALVFGAAGAVAVVAIRGAITASVPANVAEIDSMKCWEARNTIQTANVLYYGNSIMALLPTVNLVPPREKRAAELELENGNSLSAVTRRLQISASILAIAKLLALILEMKGVCDFIRNSAVGHSASLLCFRHSTKSESSVVSRGHIASPCVFRIKTISLSSQRSPTSSANSPQFGCSSSADSLWRSVGRKEEPRSASAASSMTVRLQDVVNSPPKSESSSAAEVHPELPHGLLSVGRDSPADGILQANPFKPVVVALTTFERLRATPASQPAAFSTPTLPTLIGTMRRETLCPTPVVPPGRFSSKLPPFPSLSPRFRKALSLWTTDDDYNSSRTAVVRPLTPPFVRYMKRKREEEREEFASALSCPALQQNNGLADYSSPLARPPQSQQVGRASQPADSSLLAQSKLAFAEK